MAKKQQKNAELHAAAKLRLQDFLLASVNETGEGLPMDIREAITTIINCKRLTYRYMLFVVPGTGNNKGVCEARITLAKHPVLRVSAHAGMLFNGMGRPIDLSRPCQTLPASMGGNKTPIIDTRLLKDPTSPDWLKQIHIKAIKGVDLSKTKVPKFMRRITVSEAAALQGFPKDFEFCGSQCDKYRQIGNSVPPPFAYAIASQIIFSWGV